MARTPRDPSDKARGKAHADTNAPPPKPPPKPPSRPSPRPPSKSSPNSPRKPSQRARLIMAMVDVANREGYEGATVSRVIERAGVSRPTFYEQFADREDCFIKTHRELARRLLPEIDQTLSESAPEHAIGAAILRLVQLAEQWPERAGFLTNATMGGGKRAMDERDRLIDRLSSAIERRLAHAPRDAVTPDLPPQLAMGAVRWLLAPALRMGERDLSSLARDLDDWAHSYARPGSQHRWKDLTPSIAPPRSPYRAEISLHEPPPLPRGRPRLSKSEIARIHRARIMYATAKIARAKGYTATTIAEIANAAGVDGRVFYRHFRDKQQAFLAVHDLGAQQAVAVTATAFFSAEEWTERVWEGLRATTWLHADEPLMTHIGFVESHALGAPAIQRIEDSRRAFTIFLQEGNQYTQTPPSRTGMEAIAAAIFEIAYRQARAGDTAQMPRLTSHGAYITLAPYIGPHAAEQLVDAKLPRAPGTKEKLP